MSFIVNFLSLGRRHLVPLVLVSVLFLMPWGDAVYAPILVLLLMALYALLRRQIAWSDNLHLYLFVVALLVLPLLLTSPWHLKPLASIEDAVRMLLVALAGLALFWHVQKQGHLHVFVWLAALLLLFWSLDALWQYYSGTNILGYPYNRHRLTGMFHPNMRLGNTMAHWLPFAFLALHQLTAGRWQRAWLWLLLSPVVVAIVLSGDRAAWLMVASFLPLYALALLWRRQLAWRPMLVLLAILAVSLYLSLQFSNATQQRFQSTMQVFKLDAATFDQASSGRLNVWRGGWLVSKQQPWTGVGSKALGEVATELGWRGRNGPFTFTHTHLYGLDVLVHTGWLGFIAYALALLLLLYALWRARFQASDLALVALLAALVALSPLNTHWGIYASRASSAWLLLLAIALATYPALTAHAAGRKVADKPG